VALQREGRLAGGISAVETEPYRPTVMSVLAPAVGAVLAAILESSVLTHLQVGSVKPDLVFAVGIAMAMALGFESGMTWAFVGGVTLDLLLPGRALGSTALTLVLLTATALVVARALWPPRLAFVAVTAFVLSFAYQAVLLALLAMTTAIAFSGLSLPELVVGGLLNAAIALVAAIAVRALDLRFGEPERLAW
jgi:rod shape-determining protein MreD